MSEQTMNLPKQLLKIEDLTFQLPDDFKGDIKSALSLLVEYLHSVFGDNDIDPKRMNEMKKILENNNSMQKVAMNFGIFELGNDGKYHLK